MEDEAQKDLKEEVKEGCFNRYSPRCRSSVRGVLKTFPRHYIEAVCDHPLLFASLFWNCCILIVEAASPLLSLFLTSSIGRLIGKSLEEMSGELRKRLLLQENQQWRLVLMLEPFMFNFIAYFLLSNCRLTVFALRSMSCGILITLEAFKNYFLLSFLGIIFF